MSGCGGDEIVGREVTKIASPDGTRDVWVAYDDDGYTSRGLFVANADGSGERRLTSKEDTNPAWSPNGKAIAFERPDEDSGVTGSIYTIDPDGGRPRLLVAEGETPAWSPDGKAIAYGAPFGEFVGILDLERRRTKRIPLDTLGITDLVWSPDGTRIAMAASAPDAVSDAGGGYAGLPLGIELFVIAIEGSQTRRLTHNTHPDWPLRWTDDGRIVFATQAGDEPEEFVVAPDGTGLAPQT